MPWWLQIAFVVPSFLLVLLFVREPEKHEINGA